jgi:myo-inositol-1(or 4)-monophosphatase
MNVMIMAVQKAARGLIRDFGELEKLQASPKSFGNFVTSADKRSEALLIEELSLARPDYDFLTEESGEIQATFSHSKFDKSGGYRWIVDPLDGTMNFWHGVPYFSISIALAYYDEIIAGVVYNPVTNELFWAEKGKGAFLNKQRLRVSGRKDLEAAIVCTGSVFGERLAGKMPQKMPALVGKVGSFRHFGASTLDLAFVAAGRFDAFFETSIHLWDQAAGQILIREAGGIVAPLEPDPDSILASNPALYNPLRLLLTKPGE